MSSLPPVPPSLLSAAGGTSRPQKPAKAPADATPAAAGPTVPGPTVAASSESNDRDADGRDLTGRPSTPDVEAAREEADGVSQTGGLDVSV